MATVRFSKWHGTGNDFILIDDREGHFPADDLALVRRLCDRHFGIGSDGLILIQRPRGEEMDFHMEFFNPDGSKSFCGNGSRCAFACWSGLNGGRATAHFTAIDGLHTGGWSGMNGAGKEVAVSLGRVSHVQRGSHGTSVDFIHNGSPHELVWVEDPEAIDIMTEGRRRRYDPRNGEGGANVNFLRVVDGEVRMRTYERGVEAETLSCGTGVVAAALSALDRRVVQAPVTVVAPGGTLKVEAQRDGEGYDRIVLIGPAQHVFTGEITL